MRSPESNEILHHALIAGAVASVLSASDIVRTEIIRNKISPSELPWTLYALPVLVFVIGFILVLAFEWWWHQTTPVRLKDVDDYVGGWWIYATRDVGSRVRNFNRGSVMFLKSSGLGFTLEGWSYSHEELKQSPDLAVLEPSGTFAGRGSQWTDSSIYYCYRGGEFSRGDSGVGYYGFRRSPTKELRIEGSFTGLTLGSGNERIVTRLLEGRRIEPEKKHEKELEFNLDHGKALLLQYLDECAGKMESSYVFPGVGDVKGKWVDAIFDQDGNLVAGSLIVMFSSGMDFTIHGWTYGWEDVQKLESDPNADIEKIGEFTGTGRPMPVQEGIHYDYHGHEGLDDTGVGDYLFSRNPDRQDELTFRGHFMSKSRGLRTVKGLRADEEEWKRNGGKMLLLRFMKKHASAGPGH